MNEINRLMEKFAKDYDEQDVADIIAYVRKQLAQYDAGIKPKRAEVEQLDMTQIIANITKTRTKITTVSAPPKANFKRRV